MKFRYLLEKDSSSPVLVLSVVICKVKSGRRKDGGRTGDSRQEGTSSDPLKYPPTKPGASVARP